MTAYERLTRRLIELGYQRMWIDHGDSRNNQYSLWLKQASKEIGSPIKLIFILTYPGSNGFEVFHSASDQNDVSADIEAIEEYTKKPIKPLHVSDDTEQPILLSKNELEIIDSVFNEYIEYYPNDEPAKHLWSKIWDILNPKP